MVICFCFAELYEQAIKYEKGSFIASSGALATLSGAKTGRSPRDKRVVKDETTEHELWWGKWVSLTLIIIAFLFPFIFIKFGINSLAFWWFRGSPNIEMDEHTFLVNRERAVDYLNSLDKVILLIFFSHLLYYLSQGQLILFPPISKGIRYWAPKI